MKSTGEVMGVALDFPSAYAKSQLAIDYSLPDGGTAFISVCDRDKRSVVRYRASASAWFRIRRRGERPAPPRGRHPGRRGAEGARGAPQHRRRAQERRGPAGHQHAVGRETRSDGYHIRTAAVQHGVSNITTLAAAQASVQAIEAMMQGRLEVIALRI